MGENVARRSGLRSQLESLVDIHYPSVLQLLTRLTGSSLTAEEIAQDTFVGLVKSWRPLGDSSQDRAYVFRSAYNTWYRACRERRVEPLDQNVLEDLCDQKPAILDSLCTRETVNRIYSTVYSLPQNHRAAFVLIVLEGLRYDEAAAVMGVARQTISLWRTNAVRAIRASLDAEPAMAQTGGMER